MRAREFIVKEQVAAALAAPVIAPVKNASSTAFKDFVKGSTAKLPSWQSQVNQAKKGPMSALGVGVDQADNLYGYADQTGDFLSSQATQNVLGRTLQGTAKAVTPDKAALRAMSNQPIKSTLAKAAPRTLGMLGTAVRTGTGLAPTLALYSKELGPETPKVGPYKGSELNPITGNPWTRQELDDFNVQYADWKPEYDEHGKQIKAKYDADNPIRTAIRNKTGIELPFGGDFRSVLGDKNYNPTGKLPKVVNDPNADLIKIAQDSRMDLWQAQRDLERAQANLDRRKPDVK